MAQLRSAARRFTRKSVDATSTFLAGEGLIPKPVDPREHLQAFDKVVAEVKAKHAKFLE